MKIFSVFFFCTLMIFNAIIISLGMPHTSNIRLAEEDSTDDFVFSILPLRTILEHQLQAVKASKRSNSAKIKSEDSDKNLKSNPDGSDTRAKNICSEMQLRKKASPEEISKILSGDVKFEDEARLQEIYDFVKECQFVKVRSSKLSGPIWHCLNRLFLFFVFG